MFVRNVEVEISRSELAGVESLGDAIQARLGENALRWFISRAGRDGVTVEATLLQDVMRSASTQATSFHPGKSAVLSIIPTGVGCELGGYAGDASPITRLLSTCADYVITNPNALNGSEFVGSLERVLYTEGYCIDLLSKGLVDLWVPQSNKVGLVIEKADEWMLDVVFNVMNTMRAIHGIDIDYVITDEPIGSRSERNPSGAYVGSIANPKALFLATEKLLKAGATAIGITTNIQGLPGEEYVQHFLGRHPNPMGGVEALISHLVVNKYGVPAAHAPMINLKGEDQVESGRTVSSSMKKLRLARSVVDARGAGEMTSVSGLACILAGLAKAPQIQENRGCRFTDRINLKNVVAVVAPASALGGIPVLSAAKHGIPVIAVRSNVTILDVTASRLGLKNVIEVENYTEAAGLVLALRNGISLESLYRPLRTLDYQNVQELVVTERAVANG
ncbi:DUF3326 domain-containing protein [Archangium sp.]|uniref:DUF3326 domain-containing protein n=1 Tax=Archangium sp. TaxID=1872627 RepID=UPI002D316E4B|nr:DUF3326 domain-containing protein [Archangium sp.]HYO56005.1 DUF3326 domain-containing protein [Archangium sp.]